MKRISMILLFLFAAWIMVNETAVHTYVGLISDYAFPAAKHTNSLYEEIIKKAPKYEIKPINATIDKVWKAIPGYNGLMVDIPASYKKMEKDGIFKEKDLVFKQIKPMVHLQDLPASPIYRGNSQKPMVSFLINVAWGNEYLPGILATLKKHHITATFFLEGNWVKKNPDLAKMIAESGNEIGNHSFSHPDMKLLTAERARAEMLKTNEVIQATIGRSCEWFAPPSGSYNADTVRIADQLNMKTVMWTVDTVDWRNPSPDDLINRVMGKIGNGSMVLMHPTEATANALDRLITQIEQKNLKIGSVSELISENRMIGQNEKIKQQ